MIRALKISLNGGHDPVFIYEDTLKRLYAEFNLPFPDINKPVLSKEFRKAVNEYGLTLLLVDDEHSGVLEYIPPTQIKSIRFYIYNPEKISFKKLDSDSGWAKVLSETEILR